MDYQLLAPAPLSLGTKPPARLLDQVRAAIRMKHYSAKTGEAYVNWARQFILFHNKRHPGQMGEIEVGQFLQHLALNKGVAASTQNQALSALLFLYGNVLRNPLGKLPNVFRAKRPKRLPSVLTQDQVQRLSRVAAFVRNASVGAGMRHSDRSATNGTQRCEHNHDLYARVEETRDWREKPFRLGLCLTAQP